ncbi:hypothetical protein GCM10010502_42740 [Kitasatospora aureofaciens]|uniref:Secreted protein n=1 Tax=Kitasatospora aureofaciens TaxID=1894 RepID=A0A8H9LSE1_KITAU|nr:hypothetical protein GCM10010502_42740 [Kitasatospora aureofaciens]
MCGGLFLVFAARSPTTAGSTVTAPAGGSAGPAPGPAHTRATAADPVGAAVGSGGASEPLVQPVAVSRASVSGAAAHAPPCRLVIPTLAAP